MAQLNTMEELTSWICECGCITFDNGICRSCKKETTKYGELSYDDLKQEAIKWIKRLSSPNYHFGKLEIPYSHAARDPLVAWIKYFYNITKEDYKNGTSNGN